MSVVSILFGTVVLQIALVFLGLVLEYEFGERHPIFVRLSGIFLLALSLSFITLLGATGVALCMGKL